MEPQKKPDVVDLDRYRKAAKAAKAPAAPPPAKREPVLGQRRNAGLVMAMVILATLIAFALPKLI